MSEPASSLPGRLRLVVAVEMTSGLALSWFLYAVLSAFGWPRPHDNVARDTLIIVSPAVLAIMCGIFAHRVWRAGHHRAAMALVIAAGTPIVAGALLWSNGFA